ncbi:UDP-N-acetyl glucosamine 2-epimerase [Bacteroides reticulotermitis]|uniref:UDP-N-acetylglucosamine 2-epimerase n=2 Tax=Bacteroides reticulotermitis TaxID=1133319 RepID=W4UTC1_9BACE|nr:UDP-N-acetyl glucosamine 2-epimerase [Bacteroides reticulotermitis]MBB4045576.1 UDP-N-acetylglucosamine 2-epimerase (non-hydrolyzing) [Bacteroides reticulotermitis]GAE84450.1 UDP-N-acetylglucosamine 2-epimerase [Bacteroides reticulotermitis JCM 10512]
MKITIVAGARPNFMKIAPITRAIDKARGLGKSISYRLVYTGRKDDTSLDASLFADLDMKTPDVYLGVEGSNPTQMSAAIMIAFEQELTENPVHVVLVVDDLNATMSCAIVAKKLGVKVAHLVAGIRSFDMNMPKEVNRMITDGLSDYLFTAGMVANRNLNQTGTETNNVYYVGNILIDTIRYNRNRLLKPVWFSVLGLKENAYLLFTLNRRALLNDPDNLRKLIETTLAHANGTPVVAPLHAYVSDAIKAMGIDAPNFHIMPPQSYLCFGYLMNKAQGIITDSGNVAEEATFLGIPCITLNTYAEHPETWRMGTNELVGEDSEALAKAMDTLMRGEWKHGELPERWDGRTAERIVQILTEE